MLRLYNDVPCIDGSLLKEMAESLSELRRVEALAVRIKTVGSLVFE